MSSDYDFSGFFFGVGGDSAEVCPMDMAFLTPKQASVHRKVRVASLEDLKGFSRISEETLVHKIDRDLWVIKAENGSLFIERQFDETGAPLKG